MAATLAAEVRSTVLPLWGGTAVVATCGDPSRHDDAVAEGLAWIDDVDAACSTYLETSELVRLNASSGRELRVGPVLRGAVEVALEAARRTRGLVDPAVGTVTLGRSGVRLTRTSSWLDVVVRPDGDGALIRLPEGCLLDLGATCKAWAADVAAQRASDVAGGALVSLLGDVAVAGPTPENGWHVVVTDDHREGTGTANPVAQTVALHGGGLATSSTSVRTRLRADGSTAAHIVDPRTLVPVEPVWRTVSVAAMSCVEANAASTAAVVLGEGAAAWLGEQGLTARLVGRDGSVQTVGAWPV